MDFELTDEQQAIRDEVRRFAENEVEPIAKEYDQKEEYPWEIIDKAAEMGLTGATFPIEYGGAGYSLLKSPLSSRNCSPWTPGIGLCITSTAFGGDAIREFGTEEQKEEYLHPSPPATPSWEPPSANRTRGPTCRRFLPRPRRTATSGSSTATRCGLRTVPLATSSS